MGVFSNSVTLRTCRIWWRLVLQPETLLEDRDQNIDRHGGQI